MAVLGRDDFFKSLSGIIGDDTSEKSVTFIEDMTDTYNDFEKRIKTSNSAEFEKRFNDMNEAWRKRYMSRFLSGGESFENSQAKISDDSKDITINDLFGGNK